MGKEKNRAVRTIMLLALALAMTSCASAGPKQSGFLHGYYERLTPSPKGGEVERWIKPGVDFTKYQKIILEDVVIFFADNSDYKGIDLEQLQDLTKSFKQEIINAYQGKSPFTTEPGPQVVRLRVALTGLKQSNPVLSGVSTVLPVGLGISTLKRGTAGAWTGSGATDAELLLTDSVKNEVLIAVKCSYSAGFTERFTRYGSATEAFKFWAGRVKEFTDALPKIK